MTEPTQLDIETEIVKMEHETFSLKDTQSVDHTSQMRDAGYLMTDNDPED